MEQISTTALVLLEHHTRISAIITIPHAEDIEGLQVILSLMNKQAVQPHDDSYPRQSNGLVVPLISATTLLANQLFPNFQETAQCIQPLRDYLRVDMRQHTQVTSDEFTVDANVDV